MSRARLGLAKRRVEQLEVTAYTCELSVGDDVYISLMNAEAGGHAGVSEGTLTQQMLATVINLPMDYADPMYSILLEDGRTKLVRRHMLRSGPMAPTLPTSL